MARLGQRGEGSCALRVNQNVTSRCVQAALTSAPISLPCSAAASIGAATGSLRRRRSRCPSATFVSRLRLRAVQRLDERTLPPRLLGGGVREQARQRYRLLLLVRVVQGYELRERGDGRLDLGNRRAADEPHDSGVEFSVDDEIVAQLVEVVAHATPLSTFSAGTSTPRALSTATQKLL